MDIDVKWKEIIKLSEEYDEENFLLEYLQWGERFIRSIEEAPFITDEFEKIIVIGMGGSGIIGDILRDIFIWNTNIIIEVVKNSKLPGYIDKEKDLIIGVSFSGNTIETISTVKEALDKNMRVVGVTTGGKLFSILKKRNIPAALVEKALAPRAGLPQLLGSTLKIITSDEKLLKEYKEIGETLKKKADEYRIENEMNRAFMLAYYMWGRLPIFYGNIKYHSLLHRAKSSINENAKINAYYTVFPEGFHNEIEAYEEYTDPNILPVIFKEKNDEMDCLIKHFEELNIEYLIIDLTGKSSLEKILTGILLVDMSSIYLSYLRRKKPYEINVINKIKRYRG